MKLPYRKSYIATIVFCICVLFVSKSFAQTVYYSMSQGYLNELSTWSSSQYYSVSPPTSFTENNQIFVVCNNTNKTINADWHVAGEGTKIIVGNGDKCNFTIPAAYKLVTNASVVVDVADKGTLTIENENIPNLGDLAIGNPEGNNSEKVGSTVVYAGSGSQSIQEAHYYNLIISGNRNASSKILLENKLIEVSGTFTPAAVNCDWSVSNSTFVFNGKWNQVIPAFNYYNLHTEVGATKTLGGNISVVNKLRIGAISSLDASSHTIELLGNGDVVTLIGTFIPATSTVKYTSTELVTVRAMDYYNLDISGGKRVLEPKNIIGVARTFTPSTHTTTYTGSTLNFNGNSKQNIPALSYYNLQISNNAGASIVNGAATVSNKLSLFSGVISTDNLNSLTVTNPSANAVTYGNSSSYIAGPLSRHMPAKLSSSFDRWVFPVGNSSNYYECVFSKVSTGTAIAVATVEYTAPYWKTQLSGVVSGVSVSVSLPNAPSSSSAIGWTESNGGALHAIGGTVDVDAKSIRYSEVTALKPFYGITTRTVTSTTYEYKGGDITQASSWKTSSGTQLQNFSQNDVTYIVKASTTIASDFTISGSNIKFQIGEGYSLTVEEETAFSFAGNFALQKNATFTNNGIVTVFGTILFENHHGHQMYQDIVNNGTCTVYGNIKQAQGSFSRIYNNPTGVLLVYGDYYKDQNTWFYNSGLFTIMSGEFFSNSNHENYFVNQAFGKVLINNSLHPLKDIELNNINASTCFVLQENSEFFVVDADITLSGSPNFMIEGTLIIEDGNFTINQGGLPIIVTETGGLYLYDTDNNTDGVIDLNNGGLNLTVNGEAYVEGAKTTDGGGSTINVNGEMFIGNVGLYTGLNNNALLVHNGGDLYYCGNKTPLNEQLGTVHSGGTLHYAGGYYSYETPGNQGDFSISHGGVEHLAFEDAETCREAFYTGTPSGGDVILPIQLSMLYAECENHGRAMYWQTATETNNDYFTILRSFDGITFYPITYIQGAGTTSETSHYVFMDNEHAESIVYYKLLQTDFDGTQTHSKIISVSCESDVWVQFFDDYMHVTFDNIHETHLVHVFANTGQILFTQSYKNVASAVISLPQIPGVYIISVSNKSQYKSQKFVK